MQVAEAQMYYQTVLVNFSAPDGGNRVYHAPVSLPPLTLPTTPLGNARPEIGVEKNRWEVADIGIDRRAHDIPLKRQQNSRHYQLL
jgi:hypothetical protein